MLFNSLPFIYLFLPLVALIHFQLGRRGWLETRKLWLIAASLVFYAWGNPKNLAVLIGSLLFNQAVARRLVARDPDDESRARKRLLVVGLVANVALLCVFKYAGFAVENFNAILHARVAVPRLALPLGISFFTLQQIMYLMDCYEGLCPGHNLVDNALFVTFFPSVISGPIVRSRDVLPQFSGPDATRPDDDRLGAATLLFAVGLFKKAVIADSFSRFADAGYEGTQALSLLEGWVTSVSYTFQLYFDFSGYSDMAVAVAAFVGVKLPFNFDSPYKSTTVIEFWKRWHITLSNFITTYLYTPMLRSLRRVTFGPAMAATFVSMVIAGLWHGPSWNFVLFGALHGVALVVNQIWKKAKRKLPRLLAWGLTFLFVNFAFVFFRAPRFGDALRVLAGMAGRGGLLSMNAWAALRGIEKAQFGVVMLFGVIVAFFCDSSKTLHSRFRPSRGAVAFTVATAAVALLFLNGTNAKDFLYFDF